MKVLISILLVIIGCSTVNCYALDPPPITPVDEFYVFNHNGIPAIPVDWHLTVDGEVANPLALTLDDLMIYTPMTQMATLACAWYTTGYPNYFWIGNANWTGVLLNTIIEEASPLSEDVSITFHAVDGYAKGKYSLSEIVQRDDILLAYEINGETLPMEQGYPIRLVVPGNVGYEWVQWLESIEITTTPANNNLVAFPIHARIFEPQDDETIALSTHIISGVAFVGEGREVTKVEISTNGGLSWETAQLLNYFVPNVWKHWEFSWEIPQIGQYQILARAEDNLGNLQLENDSTFGWNQLSVNVNVDYDNDSDEIPDSEDNCPYDYNHDQNDGDSDSPGDACDNCPNQPNGLALGTCVKTIGGIVCTTRVTCDDNNDCEEDEYCQMEQGDCNGNDIGDACECYADCTCDGYVQFNDLKVMKQEYNRSDCTPSNPCYADLNGDSLVQFNDLKIMKFEYNRDGCPIRTGSPPCVP